MHLNSDVIDEEALSPSRPLEIRDLLAQLLSLDS